ncbi:MAG: DUF2066 domain-containing protein [Gammaproteobacteria bacterium]
MKFKWFGIIVLLGGLFTNLSIFAALDKTLYSAAIPIASESAADLQKTLPQALGQVLIQVTGNVNIANSAFIQQQLLQAANFIQSYTYENDTLQDTPGSLVLKVQFDPRSVNQLLQKAGQAPQPAVQYPPLLVWIAVPSGQAHNILDTNAQDPVALALREAAKSHHMTVLLPLLDLQDMNDMTADQVWQLDTQTAISASVRYNVQNILLGRVNNTPDGQWQADWILISPQRNWQWHTAGTTPQVVLQNVLNKVAQTFAKQPTANSASTLSPQHVKVHITGVSGLDQFAGIVKYFRGLAPVNHVETTDVSNKSLTLDVTVNGGATALDNVVQEGQSLLPDKTSSNTSTDLYYQWVGGAE